MLRKSSSIYKRKLGLTLFPDLVTGYLRPLKVFSTFSPRCATNWNLIHVFFRSCPRLWCRRDEDNNLELGRRKHFCLFFSTPKLVARPFPRFWPPFCQRDSSFPASKESESDPIKRYRHALLGFPISWVILFNFRILCFGSIGDHAKKVAVFVPHDERFFSVKAGEYV